ncbi:MAG TPA: hypothetical protein VHO24_20020 [Opitutaceae bacterium]|nr:hypothetical protein [Opitutaceae bacterium]
MPNSLLHHQFACDRAAREFLALAAWGFNRTAVRAAVNQLTSGTHQPPSALAWLVEHVAKLPQHDEAERLLHDLVQADAALRIHRSRPEATRESLACVFAGRLRYC